jgi:DNA-directed RNA polymerase subunit RPC12/RpoP
MTGGTPPTDPEENPMADVYKCESCGAVTKEKGHLCKPRKVEEKCDYCGEKTADARHVCKPMRPKLEYVCGGCGRPAESADLVCKPKKMPG